MGTSIPGTLHCRAGRLRCALASRSPRKFLIRLGAFALFCAALILAPQPAPAQLIQEGAKLVGNDATGSPILQGYSAALSSDGNTAIVGALLDNSGVGAAWVYTRSSGVWSQQGNKLVGSDAVGNASQGQSVALSADGNTAIVGGPSDNFGAGAAWVFTRSGNTWSQQGNKLVGTGTAGNGQQGTSVALSADGNTAIVGGQTDNSSIGAAWVYTRSSGVWSQQGSKLVGTGAVGIVLQGSSVALSADGNTAIVGGQGDNSQIGAAWVYTRSGGVWTQQGDKLVGAGAVGPSRQGFSASLSIDGNTAIVGGFTDNSGIGAAWVYTRSGGVWTQQGTKLVGTGAVGSSRQGTSVSLSADGNTAIAGGYNDNSAVGAAWLFTRSGGVWSQQGTKLVGTGAVGAADQGVSAALSGDGLTAIVGGYNDNNGIGAAWVFSALTGVSSVNPNSGTRVGGTNVTITGVGFTGATSVTFGGTAATNFNVVNDTTITATTPVHTVGAVDVVVTATLGTGTRLSAFTYTDTLGVSTTSVVSSHITSPVTEPVTFTATVSGTTITPTGTLIFKDNGVTFGAADLSGGTAAITTASLSFGNHPITTVYLGDANFTGSTSPGITQHVTVAFTTTTLSSFSPNPSVVGQSVTMVATVAPAAPATGTPPDGTVTFHDGVGGPILGFVALSGGTGRVEFSTAALSLGVHQIHAVFSNSALFNQSESSPDILQTVNQDATSTFVGSAPNPSNFGQSVTFTATVTVLAPGSGTPSGTVTFNEGATTLGSGSLSGGVATFSTSSLAIGGHTITAAYGGDGTFAASASSTPQTVAVFHSIAVSAAPAAGGSVGGGGSFLAGSSQTVTASANSGYTFVDWKENGVEVSTSPSYNFTLDADRNLVATFSSGGLSFYVSLKNGSDSGTCPVTAPCATLNYALSVSGAGGTIVILDSGVFGPVVLTKEIFISGSDPKIPVQIVADPTTQVGCIASAPANCGLTNNGYAVEIAAGATDSVKMTNVILDAGPSGGADALKFTSGGTVQLSENVYRGNDTEAGPIIALYPNNPGTTQAQVYFSNSDVGFNNIGANAGAVEVKPSGNTSLKLHFNHVEVHNASYGIRTDSSLLSGPAVVVATAISESEMFSFANAAVNAFSTAGTGTTNATFDAVRILNANVAIKANGPLSTVILTNSTVSGNGTGVQVLNGAHVYTPQNNTIFGNGADVSGSLSAAPPR